MRGANVKIIIQERDRHLLKELATFRVIDREQAKTIGGFNSTTRANTRLLALTKAGLLRRFFLGASEGSKKAVYSLSSKGAALVGATVRGPRRPNDGLLVADFFVLHQLAINDMYCALARACATVGISLVRWLSFHEPLAQNLRLIPDGYCELSTPTNTIANFLEVDLGHERLKVWTEKISNYIQFAVSGDCEPTFGRNQFHVLVIANSERRLESIRKAVLSSTHKIFWFATIDAIRSQGPFAAIWLRPEGDDHQSLFPAQPSTP
jgi:protein involved in plasmid replication-relaxation